MLWHIELKFYIWLWYTVLQIKFECRQFPSSFVGVMPLFGLRILEIHSFLHWKYTAFCTFLLHALTYWAEILHMTLFYCTTDQVWVLSICINFCACYALFGPLNTRNTQFFVFFSYMLWHIELKFCIWICLTVLHIKFECHQFASIFVGVMTLFDLRILEIHSNPHFSDFMLWHIELKFYISLCLMYYRSILNDVNLHQFL